MVGIFFQSLWFTCRAHRRRAHSGSMSPPNGSCATRPQDPPQGNSAGLFFNLGNSGGLRDVVCRRPLSYAQFPQLRIEPLLVLRLYCPPTLHSLGGSLRGWCLLQASVWMSLPPGSLLLPSPHLGSLAHTSPGSQRVIKGICIHAQLKGRQGSCLLYLPSPEPSSAWHIVGTQNMCAG